MRTDITIDRKQVRCPNASHLGFDKWKAQVGDLILFKEGTQTRTGRMIGRIAYALPEANGKRLENFIVAVCINEELSHTFERWVDPNDVLRVQPIGNEYIDRRAVVEWFLSDDMTKANVEEVRRCVSDGWSTLAKYRENEQKKARDIAEFNERQDVNETTEGRFQNPTSDKKPERITRVQ